MFKSIITAAAAASIAVAGFATGADASTRCRTLPNGWDVCTINNGHYAADSIGAWNQYGNRVLTMSVICTGNGTGGHRWNGSRDTRYVSYSDMQSTADWWCRGY